MIEMIDDLETYLPIRVTDTILAMARPNYTEMKKHNMIDSFKKYVLEF